MARPLQPVVAPPAAAPRYGLIASSPPVTDQGDRWIGGITYVPEGCVDGEYFGTCEYGTETTPVTDPATVEWWPYQLSVTVQCSSFSGRASDLEERARRLLQQQTETLIGRELWEGNFAQTETDNPNHYLAHADSDNLSHAGAVGFTHALACLEEYLSKNNGGQQGMIHATPQIVTHWEAFRLLRREGNKILTFKDTLVIPSPGYSGISPTGDIGDNDIWAYATDMVRLWIGDIRVDISEDRQDNTFQAIAQRPALAEWPRCRHAAVQIAAIPCDSGGS